MCMLRELGPQSLFLTFSNNVPDKYSINKLCNEDPVLVLRQFSHKFHTFFHTSRALLLEKRVPGTWSTTLSCSPMDKGCTDYNTGNSIGQPQKV